MSAYLRQVLQDNPQLLWSMLQRDVSGTTMKDLSGNGRDGTVSGSPAYTASFGGLPCLNFDGVDDKVGRANDAALNAGTGAYVIEWWMLSSVSSSNYVEIMSRDAANTGTGPEIYLQITTGALRLWSGSTVTPSVGTKRLNDGLLNHCVVQRTAGGVHSLTVNGVADTGSYQTTSLAVTGTSTLAVAILDATVYTKYAGLMTYFAFYVGQSLPADRIASHYQAGLREAVSY
jgi:hypothetical protein